MEGIERGDEGDNWPQDSPIIEEDVPAELDEFVRLVHLRQYDKAKAMFDDCLSVHKDWLPVAVEHVEFLLQISAGPEDVGKYLEDGRLNEGLPTLARAYFLLATDFASLQQGHLTPQALVDASVIWLHFSTRGEFEELQGLDASPPILATSCSLTHICIQEYTLSLLLRTAISIQSFQENCFSDLSSFPSSLREQGWSYFVTIFECLLQNESWWHAHEILRSLFVVLDVTESRKLLQGYVNRVHLLKIPDETAAIGLCSAIQSFLQFLHCGNTFYGWKWNDKLSSALFPQGFSRKVTESGTVTLHDLETLTGITIPWLERSPMYLMRNMPPTNERGVEQDDRIPRSSSLRIFTELAESCGLEEGLVVALTTGNQNNVLRFLKAGTSIDSVDWLDRTALHRAILCGENDIVKLLMSVGVNVFCSDWFSLTPLHLAAKENNISAIQTLLSHNKNARRGPTYSAGFNQWTPLHFASFYGHIDAMKSLLENGANLNEKTQLGLTPLMLAAGRGHLTSVSFLQTRANSEARSRGSRTSFLERRKARDQPTEKFTGGLPITNSRLWGTELDTQDALIKWLFFTLGKPLSEDRRKRTKLPKAIMAPPIKLREIMQATIADLLLQHPIDQNWQDALGRTPLSYAAASGNHLVIKLLLAQPNIRAEIPDKASKSPTSYAALFGTVKSLELLLDYEDATGEVRSPFLLMDAIVCGNTDTVRFLLQEKNEPNLNYDWNPGEALNLASARGHNGIVELLLQQPEMDINGRNGKGDTSLQLAVEIGSDKVVRMLVGRDDVDVNRKSSMGVSSLSRAVRSGHDDVVEALLARKDIDLDLQYVREESMQSHGQQRSLQLVLDAREKRRLEAEQNFESQ